jgi:hypothetical protein
MNLFTYPSIKLAQAKLDLYEGYKECKKDSPICAILATPLFALTQSFFSIAALVVEAVEVPFKAIGNILGACAGCKDASFSKGVVQLMGVVTGVGLCVALPYVIATAVTVAFIYEAFRISCDLIGNRADALIAIEKRKIPVQVEKQKMPAQIERQTAPIQITKPTLYPSLDKKFA